NHEAALVPRQGTASVVVRGRLAAVGRRDNRPYQKPVALTSPTNNVPNESDAAEFKNQPVDVLPLATKSAGCTQPRHKGLARVRIRLHVALAII
ncbi:hypothetical protein ACFL34_05775, partial [Candidatus Sumerlaeota bacterium]